MPEGTQNSHFITVPEVLSHVFVDCLPRKRFLRPRKEDAPLLLTQVCKYWREVALSEQTLWCALDMPAQQFDENHIKLMATWLKRSGCRPISIRIALQSNINARHIEPCISDEFAATALRIFLDSMTRCQYAELVWDHPNFPFLAIAHPVSSPLRMWTDPKCPPLVGVPVLEGFALTAPNLVLDEVKNRVNCLLHGAPRLLAFELFNNKSTEMSSVDIKLPWVQLFDLTLEYDMSLTDCILILSECLMLRTAVFRRVGQLPFENSLQSRHRLSHLQCLKIQSIDRLSPFFESFELPSLKEADFELGMDEDDDGDSSQVNIVDEWDEEPFLDFLRHTCLHTLGLKAPISEPHLIECLKVTSPTLRTLRVTSEVIRMTSPFLRVNLSSGSFVGCVSMVDYPFGPSTLMEFRCSAVDDIPADNIVHLGVTRDIDGSFTFDICDKQSIDLPNK